MFEKYVAKKLETEWKDVKMPYRVAITIAGQTLSPGLERYLNNISRKHKYGVSRLLFPLAPVTMTIGGGTTENGGIFYTLFKGLNEKKLPYILTREHMNLKYEKMVEFESLIKMVMFVCLISEEHVTLFLQLTRLDM